MKQIKETINLKIKLKSFNSVPLDKTAFDIISRINSQYQNFEIIGPIAIPRRIDIFSAEKNISIVKKENGISFMGDRVRYDRFIYIKNINKDIVDDLQTFEMHQGVTIEIQIEIN